MPVGAFEEGLIARSDLSPMRTISSYLAYRLMAKHSEYGLCEKSLKDITDWNFSQLITEQEYTYFYETFTQEFDYELNKLLSVTTLTLDEQTEHIDTWGENARKAEAVISNLVFETVDGYINHAD